MDFYALLTCEFDQAVDAVSRAMFHERMGEHGWRPVGPALKLEFEARSRATCHDTVESHLKLACQFARFDRSALKATVEFFDDEA
ncbi:MAG: hypothetical protein H6839_13410 [Planctomycetes bacterium]|nr:hypothetical protein [Planctomycetota bacterium]